MRAEREEERGRRKAEGIDLSEGRQRERRRTRIR